MRSVVLEKEKGHRANGDQLEKNSMQNKDTTNKMPNIAGTCVPAIGKSLLDDLSGAFKQLADTKQELLDSSQNFRQTEEKIKVLGYDPDYLEAQIQDMKNMLG